MDHVKTGKADVKPDLPSHLKGINQGNTPGNNERNDGHEPDGTSRSRRSTGISPDDQEAIDPRMPNISPA